MSEFLEPGPNLFELPTSPTPPEPGCPQPGVGISAFPRPLFSCREGPGNGMTRVADRGYPKQGIVDSCVLLTRLHRKHKQLVKTYPWPNLNDLPKQHLPMLQGSFENLSGKPKTRKRGRVPSQACLHPNQHGMTV